MAKTYTYKELCDKIGFDPLTTKRELSEYEIDDTPTPFSVLTYDEATALERMLEERLREKNAS